MDLVIAFFILLGTSLVLALVPHIITRRHFANSSWFPSARARRFWGLPTWRLLVWLTAYDLVRMLRPFWMDDPISSITPDLRKRHRMLNPPYVSDPTEYEYWTWIESEYDEDEYFARMHALFPDDYPAPEDFDEPDTLA